MKISILLIILFSGFFIHANAQDVFLPLNDELNTRYDEWLARKDVKLIPTIKPYRADELRDYMPFDSVESDIAKHYFPNSDKAKHSWANRKLFSEHFVDVNDTTDNFRLMID